MKTPIEQLIDAIKSRELQVVFSTKIGIYLDGDIDKFLDIEKTAIITAHSEGIRFMAGNTTVPQEVSKHYFDKLVEGKIHLSLKV